SLPLTLQTILSDISGYTYLRVRFLTLESCAMRNYNRWFSIAASVVFLAGIADTALFVHTKLNGLFESLIPIRVPGTTELSLNEAGLYTVFLHIPPGDQN